MLSSGDELDGFVFGRLLARLTGRSAQAGCDLKQMRVGAGVWVGFQQRHSSVQEMERRGLEKQMKGCRLVGWAAFGCPISVRWVRAGCPSVSVSQYPSSRWLSVDGALGMVATASWSV